MNDLRKDDGGPAFPRATGQDGGWESAPLGMSLRDYFAAKALHAEIITTFSDVTPRSAEAFIWAAEKHGRTITQHLAFNAYEIADAMLAERAQ